MRRSAFGAVLLAPGITLAQGQPVVLDLAIPESPAAASLSNGEPVLKPSTPREFATSILGLVDRKGKFSPGVSVEVAPYLLAKGPTRISGYANKGPGGYALRSLVGTQVSLATSSADQATGKAQRMALGLRVPIFDLGDPRMDHTLDTCFRLLPPPKFPKDVDPEALPVTEDLPAEVKAALKQCYAASKLRNWNAAAMSVAFAQLYADEGTERADLRRQGRTFWVNLALPFGAETQRLVPVGDKQMTVKTSAGQIILQGRLAKDAIDSGDSPVDERRYDGTAYGGRLRWGSDRFNVHLGGSRERRKFDLSGRRDDSTTYAGGFEGRVMKDLWVRVNIGRERKESTGSDPFANFVLSWSSESEPAFDPRPRAAP
jgi:hypothetical protein